MWYNIDNGRGRKAGRKKKKRKEVGKMDFNTLYSMKRNLPEYARALLSASDPNYNGAEEVEKCNEAFTKIQELIDIINEL